MPADQAPTQTRPSREVLVRRAEWLAGLPNVLTRSDKYAGIPLTVRLDDGTIGYCMRPGRDDDCFRAAIATVLQVPIEDVPDPQFDRRLEDGWDVDSITEATWAALIDWLSCRHLRVILHTEPPMRRKRWIGVVPDRGGRPFRNHSLVMTRGEILFDPAANCWHLRDGCGPGSRFQRNQVTWGISFQRAETA
jgi:hypothetical protein